MSTLRINGPWSRHTIDEYLSDTVVPMRLSVVSRAGWPLVISLWFLHEEGKLFAACRQNAKVIEHLAANPRCGFEIAPELPPYHGVRGYGVAELSADSEAGLLKRLVDRYLGPEETPFRRWLLDGSVEETAIAIRPERLTSWDYRERMAKTF